MGLGHLGWTPEVFYDASLDELLLAYEGYAERQKREDFRVGNVMALMANMRRDEQKRSTPYHPADFFGSLSHPEETAEDDAAEALELTPELFDMLNCDPVPPQEPATDGEVK